MSEARASISGAASGRPHSHFGFWALVAWLAITIMWWALAFAPLPAPRVWLAEARAVCFGTLPNGLPEPWGWGSLIVTPVAMLGFLMAVWGRDVIRDLHSIAGRIAGRAVLSLLVTIPLLGAGWVVGRVIQARGLEQSLTADAGAGGLPENYPMGDSQAPRLRLVDQTGEAFSLEDVDGRPVLLTFAFAHCRTVCPIVVDTVRSAAAEVPDLSPAVVIVTLDPWRDTPGSLPDLLRGWQLDGNSAAHVLSGDVEDVLEVLDAWEMPINRNLQNGDIVHPATVHVVAPDGKLAYSFQNPPADWVAEAARRASARSQASPGTRAARFEHPKSTRSPRNRAAAGAR